MSFIFIYNQICKVCVCVCLHFFLAQIPRKAHALYSPLSPFSYHRHTHTQGGLSGCWLMTVICQAEVDKTVNIIFVLRARAHRTLPLVSFISGWTQQHAGTRRQPGSQQIYSHYFSIRTSASTDQALHLYTNIREGKERWMKGREERRGGMTEREELYKGEGKLDISEFD